MGIYLVSTSLFQAVVIAEGAAEAHELVKAKDAGDASVLKLGKALAEEKVRIVIWRHRWPRAA